ncbi:MAG: hypothetical protein KJ601_08070 [Nanoarchaeota archaeon]|nr:hypothetical protein [Nanoarchaeota archaeon]
MDEPVVLARFMYEGDLPAAIVRLPDHELEMVVKTEGGLALFTPEADFRVCNLPDSKGRVIDRANFRYEGIIPPEHENYCVYGALLGQ